MLIVALLLLIAVAYFAPVAFAMTMLFASPIILIFGLYYLMTKDDRMFMDYFAELREIYPNGAMYLGSTRISTINDAFFLHFRIDDVAREIVDHGVFITLKVEKRFLVFWKDDADKEGYTRVV